MYFSVIFRSKNRGYRRVVFFDGQEKSRGTTEKRTCLLIALFFACSVGCTQSKEDSNHSSRAKITDEKMLDVAENTNSSTKNVPKNSSRDRVAEFRRMFLKTSSSDSLRQLLARHLFVLDPDFLCNEYPRSGNTSVIAAAIDRSVAMGDTTVLPLLALLLQKGSEQTRVEIEDKFLTFGHRADDLLVTMLEESDSTVVINALLGLGKSKAADHIDAIAEKLQASESQIRMRAAQALGEIGDQRAIDSLMEALQDTNPVVISSAMVSLGRLKAFVAFDRLVFFARSDAHQLRKHAAMALGYLGDARARKVLRKLAVWDSNSEVRSVATRAIGALNEE